MSEQPVFSGDIVSTSRVLYTPSTFAKTSLIYLQEAGNLTAHQPHVSQRTNLSSYLFFLVLSGEGDVTYAGKNYKLTAGDCCFIDCRKAYSHSTTDHLWQIQWVHFDGDMVEPIYQKYLERGGFTVYHSEYFNDYSSLLTDIYQLSTSEQFIRDMLIHLKLTSLLTSLMSESWHPANVPTDKTRESITAVKEYLDRHYADRITLDDLSAKFFINKYHLERSYKLAYNAPVTAYLLNVRITEAKKMLRFTSDSVGDIAVHCGFKDANYFIRQFKKAEGITPGEYRKSWLS